MSRQKIPKKEIIYNYWKDGLGNSILLSKGLDIPEQKKIDGSIVYACFACGKSGVQRCHIFAVSEGGANSVDNLHLLCPECHAESEMIEGESYWRWLQYQYENKWQPFQEHLHDYKVKLGYDDNFFMQLLREGKIDEAMYYSVSFIHEKEQDRQLAINDLKKQISIFLK